MNVSVSDLQIAKSFTVCITAQQWHNRTSMGFMRRKKENKTKCVLCVIVTPQAITDNRYNKCKCSLCPAVCVSDGLCNRDQAKWRQGSLEWSGSFLLPWGWPGSHRGVPAGAFTGGPACTHACITSDLNGATHTLPPRQQNYRLVSWW